MGIKIITDSGTDLPKEIIKEYNIGVVPLEIRFGDKVFLDGVDLSNDEFYRMMKQYKELPKTASPSPEQFINEFDKTDDDIMVITLSSGLSSTYNSALIAKDIYEKNSNKIIHIIDSLNASIGEGLLVLKAVNLALKNMQIDELAEQIKTYARNSQTFILLDTLENIVKGGRIGKVKAHIATLLSVKLIMKSDGNGIVDLAEKVRGSKKAFNRLAEIIGENTSRFESKMLGIAHSSCYEKAVQYKKLIEGKYKFKSVLITSIGATIGTYAGEGGILVSYI